MVPQCFTFGSISYPFHNSGSNLIQICNHPSLFYRRQCLFNVNILTIGGIFCNRPIQQKTIDNPLFYVGSRQEQIIMAKLRMGGSNLNGHLYSMKLIDSPACSCGFINENEFHFFLVCPLYNRPRVTLQNAMGNIAPFTLRILLYGSENLDLTVNKRIVTETHRFIKDSKMFHL